MTFTVNSAAFAASVRLACDQLEQEGTRNLQRVAIKVQNEARRRCPVDTGRLRSSILHTMGSGPTGPRAVIMTNVEYASYVEYGTQHMAAQPYLRPAFAMAPRWWAELA